MAPVTFFNLFIFIFLLLPLFQSLFSENHFVKAEQIIQRVAQRESGDGDQPNNISNGRLLAGLAEANANVVVAQDGSGNYRTIQEAVSRAPNYSPGRYLIYIKAGRYAENVVVDQQKWNLTFAGDGKGRTVLTTNRAGPRFSILTSGALVVIGDGFLARYMTFENTAGPNPGQAVAMRSYSHRSAFYHCSFLGYQDTLFVHMNYQFYKECDIVGTIDFIFGDASVVFQDCNILLRRPLSGQANVIIAQGKEVWNSPSGIVLQNCHIAASENLGWARSYLARPWQKYSTAIIMQSSIDWLIDPAGFIETPGIIGNGKTSTIREYANYGPGSNTQNRVKWAGYKVLYNAGDAQRYTVAAFINGNQWLPSLGVPYKAGL
ncbi:pectinesterase-like [Aristolochia californica]|uniref:pectinesterase-like n=1 Tax=Aristolochia californica TaxID=171875 RepID=UPI0035E3559E